MGFWELMAFAVVLTAGMIAGLYLLDRARHRRDLEAYRRLRREEREMDAEDDGDDWKVR